MEETMSNWQKNTNPFIYLNNIEFYTFRVLEISEFLFLISSQATTTKLGLLEEED